uniref:(northern house mosquito) hypothetical protein n=1 Tax=Culex pipiens TaxID=7175 RepID=A0A8D8FAU1_CULPI
MSCSRRYTAAAAHGNGSTSGWMCLHSKTFPMDAFQSWQIEAPQKVINANEPLSQVCNQNRGRHELGRLGRGCPSQTLCSPSVFQRRTLCAAGTFPTTNLTPLLKFVILGRDQTHVLSQLINIYFTGGWNVQH